MHTDDSTSGAGPDLAIANTTDKEEFEALLCECGPADQRGAKALLKLACHRAGTRLLTVEELARARAIAGAWVESLNQGNPTEGGATL